MAIDPVSIIQSAVPFIQQAVKKKKVDSVNAILPILAMIAGNRTQPPMPTPAPSRLPPEVLSKIGSLKPAEQFIVDKTAEGSVNNNFGLNMSFNMARDYGLSSEEVAQRQGLLNTDGLSILNPDTVAENWPTFPTGPAQRTPQGTAPAQQPPIDASQKMLEAIQEAERALAEMSQYNPKLPKIEDSPYYQQYLQAVQSIGDMKRPERPRYKPDPMLLLIAAIMSLFSPESAGMFYSSILKGTLDRANQDYEDLIAQFGEDKESLARKAELLGKQLDWDYKGRSADYEAERDRLKTKAEGAISAANLWSGYHGAQVGEQAKREAEKAKEIRDFNRDVNAIRRQYYGDPPPNVQMEVEQRRQMIDPENRYTVPVQWGVDIRGSYTRTKEDLMVDEYKIKREQWKNNAVKAGIDVKIAEKRLEYLGLLVRFYPSQLFVNLERAKQLLKNARLDEDIKKLQKQKLAKEIQDGAPADSKYAESLKKSVLDTLMKIGEQLDEAERLRKGLVQKRQQLLAQAQSGEGDADLYQADLQDAEAAVRQATNDVVTLKQQYVAKLKEVEKLIPEVKGLIQKPAGTANASPWDPVTPFNAPNMKVAPILSGPIGVQKANKK